MFLQIRLDPEDKDVSRFLWRNMKDGKKPRIFRFNRVTFGLNCAPFLAMAVLHHHAELNQAEYEEAAENVKRNMYVDDIVLSCEKEEDAIRRIKELRNCVICKKQETRPFEQKMADLPKMRTSETFPFENTGLDFIGPLHVDREDGCTKVYICLFTCMVTRSIHLELLSDLSAERFIQALNRFGARRGYPRIIQSDNFSTFKMADRQLKNLFSKPSLDKVQRTMSRHRIEWKFITERAPWNGGYWERLVRSVKNTLKKILGKTTLDEEELTTVLCEIEAKINARPLTFVGDDVKDADALTPFHFLIGRSFVDLPMMPTPTDEEDELPLNRKWRKRQQIILHFWKRWRNEYVTTFVSRSKWMTKRQEPKEGDIVLVKEDNTKRENWPIGRITSVLPGSDGLSRTVEVKTAKGTFTRPAARLYLLEPANTR
ncbi:hypothetical protein T01_8524 [Trichinella spiralis]|uniref:Integrase catalytic domain-containing protein n=1 Tax=Trichinella spiralis TaxID=6334 RepID=A0A0V1AUI5_TRISP|nr:hypothetical protein T01_8524 [Trichinella spiralis]